jgi:amino acid transporter
VILCFAEVASRFDETGGPFVYAGAALALVHPRYRTPHVAVMLSAALVLVLTLSSQFVYLLKVSTISRLLVFAATCVALPKLRRTAGVPAARFVLPGGLITPALALTLIAWLIGSHPGRRAAMSAS